ncbi:MAG: tetratricopeptide repeat protein [Rhodothermales bacterium]|nr:tetratricopeptide repeat protein [Rhodothermales bacterium]MDG2016197.1 tetratricopeptide repeat protein [Rhodothermales bacterium]
MKRFPILLSLLIGAFLFIGADGCSSDPNVEGAKLDLRNQDYDRALQNLETALEKDPANSEALELKGRVLSQKAFAIMDQAEHIDLIHQMVDAFTAAKNIDPLLDETVTNSMRFAYASEFTRGIQAFNRGRNDDSEFVVAARYFHTAGDIFPDSSGAFVNEAYAYMNANQPEDAIAPFEMALETGDTEPDTYRFLAGLYQTYDRVDDGIALLEDAASQFPENADVQTELLNAYQASGQIDKALESYKTAVEREPDNKLFRFNYGTLLTQIEDYPAAVAQLEKAIELDPDYSNAYYNLGAAYINMAVDVNDQVRSLDEALSAERGDLSRDQISEREATINALVDERREIFDSAIAPLETAKSLFESAGEDATGVCMALYQSYVQTDELDKARSVEECAGYSDTGE